jgi:AraC-like DNA-binding protein
VKRQLPTNIVTIEPSFRLIHNQANRSYVFKWEHFDLGTRWHYHPELELIFFIEGNTSAIVGQEFMEFEQGQLVLIGSNLPHVLFPDETFAAKFPDIDPFGLIIQFKENFLGTEFFSSEEMKAVKKMMDKGKRGISFSAETVQSLQPLLLQMHEEPDNRKLITLLAILIALAEDNNCSLLTKEGYVNDITDDENRMLRINEFLYKSFAQEIFIKDVAILVNMTESSFCRYFRSRTLKTFTRYLNEIRISYACKLLLKPSYNISDACYESGFNSLSYFNRQFNAIMNVSPKAYQLQKKNMIKLKARSN